MNGRRRGMRGSGSSVGRSGGRSGSCMRRSRSSVRGRTSRRWRASTGARIEGRAGNGVGRLRLGFVAVNIDGKTRIGVGVSAGKFNEDGCWWSDTSTSYDVKLRAFRVELSWKRVQGDSFETDEVVARRNSSRDGRCP